MFGYEICKWINISSTQSTEVGGLLLNGLTNVRLKVGCGKIEHIVEVFFGQVLKLFVITV